MKIKDYFLTAQHWNFSSQRSIHSLKTAIACLIGLAIEKYFNWPMGQWVPITIMVVMSAQTHFGGALRKAYMRLLGTVGGVATTIFVLSIFGQTPLVVFTTIFFACLFFTYIASSNGDINYAGTLGGVTVILTLTGQQVTREVAIQRGLYIVLGIAIALLVSRLIFPIHARQRLRFHIALTLRNLSKMYFQTVQMRSIEQQDVVDPRLDSDVVNDLSDQPRLIREASAGSRVFAAKKQDFVAILNNERRLDRAINSIYRSFQEMGMVEELRQQLIAVEEVHIIIEDSLVYLANCIETFQLPKNMFDISGSITKVSQLVEKLPKKSGTEVLLAEYSFLFFMEQILKDIEHLQNLIVKVNSKTSRAMV